MTTTALLHRTALFTLLATLPALFHPSTAYGQLLIDEEFDYSTGPLTTVSGGTWANGSGLIDVISGSLSYAGYSPGNGNQLHLDVSEGAEAVTVDYADQNSGTVYASFLLRTDTGLSGALSGDIFALNLSPRYASVSILGDGGDGSQGFRLCITKDTKSTDCSTETYAAQTTHLVIVAYTFRPGINDDRAKLWINPSTLPGSGEEPMPHLLDASGTDIAALSEAAFEQTGDMPVMQVDALHMSTSWNDVPLPVELASFRATADGADVVLTWTTAAEADNAGFEVQHRTAADGTGSDQPWAPLAFREGSGSTAQAQSYTFRAAALEPGLHRFRLKQVDFDGTFNYSAVVEARVEVPGAFLLSAPYPNPFTAETSFTLSVARAGTVRVAAYDVLGREVALLHEGALAAEASHRFTLDGSGLPAGLYLIRATGERLNAARLVSLAK